MSDILKDSKFIVTTDNETVELPVVPIGHDEIQQTIKRSKKSGGLTLSVIQNLEFVKQGRDLLIDSFQRYGAGANFNLVKWQKRFSKYEKATDGYLQLRTLKYDNIKATADYVENAFDAVFREQINKEYELNRLTDIKDNPIPELELSQSIHKPRKIFLESYLKTPEGFSENGNTSFAGSAILSPKVEINRASDPDIKGVQGTFHSIGSDVSISNVFHYNADRKKTLEFTFNSNFPQLNNIPSAKFVIERYKDGIDLTFVERIDLTTAVSNPTNASLVDKKITIDILEGESLKFGLQITHAIGSTYEIGESNILQEEDSLYEPIRESDQVIECITLKQAFERVILIMDQNVVFRSTLLDTQWPDLIVRNGATIRHVVYIDEETQEETKSPILTRSFEKLYKDLFYITPCAYTITQEKGVTYLNLEEIGYSFDTEEVIHLGGVQDVEFEVDNDVTFGSIEIGSTKSGDIEGVYGLRATHSKTVFKLPCNTAETIYKAETDARFDPTETEVCWREQWAENPTSDSKYDKDAFYEDCELVNISGFDFYIPHEWQEHFTDVSGIYDRDSATNYRLSPMNCLLRHGKNFKQEYMKPFYDDKKVQFLSSNGNIQMITTPIGGTARQENDDILITDLEDAMYANLKITGKCFVDYDLVKLINSGEDKPNYMKTIKFNYQGIERKAFAWDLDIDKSEMKFELKERYN